MTRARASILCLLLASVAAVASPQLARAQSQQSVPTAGGEVSIVADRFEQIGPDNLLVATGNVEVTRGTGRLLADRVEINRTTGDAVATGRAIFYDGDDRLTGERIEYNIKTGTGVVYQGELHAAPYYRLTGERLERLGESVYRVRQDATATLAAYERRGFGGAAEYRYIISNDQKGRLNGYFVDEVFKEGELRGFGSVKHDWQIAPGLSLRGDLNAVSDDTVLRDYESALAQRSAQRAESNLFLTKTWTNWSFVSRLY